MFHKDESQNFGSSYKELRNGRPFMCWGRIGYELPHPSKIHLPAYVFKNHQKCSEEVPPILETLSDYTRTVPFSLYEAEESSDEETCSGSSSFGNNMKNSSSIERNGIDHVYNLVKSDCMKERNNCDKMLSGSSNESLLAGINSITNEMSNVEDHRSSPFSNKMKNSSSIERNEIDHVYNLVKSDGMKERKNCDKMLSGSSNESLPAGINSITNEMSNVEDQYTLNGQNIQESNQFMKGSYSGGNKNLVALLCNRNGTANCDSNSSHDIRNSLKCDMYQANNLSDTGSDDSRTNFHVTSNSDNPLNLMENSHENVIPQCTVRYEKKPLSDESFSGIRKLETKVKRTKASKEKFCPPKLTFKQLKTLNRRADYSENNIINLNYHHQKVTEKYYTVDESDSDTDFAEYYSKYDPFNSEKFAVDSTTEFPSLPMLKDYSKSKLHVQAKAEGSPSLSIKGVAELLMNPQVDVEDEVQPSSVETVEFEQDSEVETKVLILDNVPLDVDWEELKCLLQNYGEISQFSFHQNGGKYTVSLQIDCDYEWAVECLDSSTLFGESSVPLHCYVKILKDEESA